MRYLKLIICLAFFGWGIANFAYALEEKPAEAASAEASAEEKKRLFVVFEPIVLPIVTDDNRNHRVRILFSLEVFKPGDIQKVMDWSPKIRGEMLQTLYRVMYAKLNKNRRFSVEQIDVAAFNHLLKNVTAAILPDTVSHEAFVLEMSHQRL